MFGYKIDSFIIFVNQLSVGLYLYLHVFSFSPPVTINAFLGMISSAPFRPSADAHALSYSQHAAGHIE